MTRAWTRLAAAIAGVWHMAPGPALAAPFAEPEPERRLGVTLGSRWASDDWLQPDGTRIRLAGQYPRLGVVARWPWRHHADLAIHGMASPLTRGDTGETLMRVGGQVAVGATRSWSHHPDPVVDYQLDAGFALVTDVQSHLTAGPPRTRPRDYLDETQLRLGPMARGGATWFHPSDGAWRAQLEVGACPTALGFSTGGVAFPVIWFGGEAGLTLIRRLGPGELAAGVEASGWRGGSFTQQTLGAFVRGSWQI